MKLRILLRDYVNAQAILAMMHGKYLRAAGLTIVGVSL